MKPIRKCWVEGGIGFIPLTQGQVATVDSEDVEWLGKWNWFAQWDDNHQGYYAGRTDHSTAKPTRVVMHRFILGLTDSKIQGDHWNHDGLDNRRFNLRIATMSQNAQNRSTYANNNCGRKGIRMIRPGKYSVRIQAGRVRRYLGAYPNLEEAHQAYVAAASKLHGDFACIG